MRAKCNYGQDTINDFIGGPNEEEYDSESDIVILTESEDSEEDIVHDSLDENDPDDEELQSEDEPSNKYSIGDFIIYKSDFNNMGNVMENYRGTPPIWKIAGKYILQKYDPFYEEEKLLYEGSPCYSGWFRMPYYLAPVTEVKKTDDEHIVEFDQNLVQQDEISEQPQQQV